MVNFVRERKKFALLTLAQAPTSTNIEHRVALSIHTLNTENSRYCSTPKNTNDYKIVISHMPFSTIFEKVTFPSC